jgi:hypothetical protein
MIPINHAIERLATELMNLSADEWARLVELRLARQEQDAVVGQTDPLPDPSAPDSESFVGTIGNTPA